MVEEILVVCYCNNNQISYKQEYSGQSSTYTISLEAEISQPCQIAAKKNMSLEEFYIFCLKKTSCE